jgi:hypothetical protein
MIPIEIINLAAEATSDYNDGWVKKEAQDRLREIKEYIERILAENPDKEVKDGSKF